MSLIDIAKRILGVIIGIEPILGFCTGLIGAWLFLRARMSPLRKFLELFHRMEKYKKRSREDSQEKRILGDYVARLILRHPDGRPLSIFIESGTTAAEVGLRLIDTGGWNHEIKVLTNNILVALAFAGKERGDQCILLPGELDDNYPGVIGDATLGKLQEVLPKCDISVLNTTSFDTLRGPCANSVSNKDIKRLVLELGKTVIICFASRKLLEQRRADAIFTRDEWHRILRAKDIHIVTCIPARHRPMKRAVFREKIKALFDDFEDEGIKVEKGESASDGRIHHLHLPAPVSQLKAASA